MKKSIVLLAALLPLCGTGVSAQDWTERLDSVVVSSSRAGENTPVTYTSLGRKELREANPIASLPMTLNLQPSVVTYNEGGTGLGNSAMTIRGVKGSQINVTLNGITLNDAESQEVFWVNIPALQSLISGVQLQRGLGTSANGAGAFGASVNMNTAFVTDEAFGRFDLTGGSYNTLLTTASVGTGLLPGGLYAMASYSEGHTDGYIRNAFVDSRSAFVALGYLQGRNSLRLTWLMGQQKSGITWDGIDLDTYRSNRRYNGAGEYQDEQGNVYYYPNQTDNYIQNHLQVNYTRSLSPALSLSNTLNYTAGYGYDEYYKTSRKLAKFNLPAAADLPTSDMIYRKAMRNDYFVINSELKYRHDGLRLVSGVNLARYLGDHYGKMLWVKEYGPDWDFTEFNASKAWYGNDSGKNDVSLFARGEYSWSDAWLAYVDLQYRHIGLRMKGADDDLAQIAYRQHWNFFNPRAGLTYLLAPGQKAYFSAALGHREPGRSDIKENSKGSLSPIRPEKMLDLELGYQFSREKWQFSANLYLMEYWDMLLETGRLSSSGYAIKENVPRSWRRGLELAASYTPATWLSWEANVSFSTNRIADYTSYVEVYGGVLGETKAYAYGESDMLLSPSLIGASQLNLQPWSRGPQLSLSGKYVGRQYLDNTSRSIMEIPAYFLMNAVLSQDFSLRGGNTLSLSLYVNNLLNRKYYASGWRYEGYTRATDSYIYGIGIYPQATRNAMLKLSYQF